MMQGWLDSTSSCHVVGVECSHLGLIYKHKKIILVQCLHFHLFTMVA
jgi:hypothetical protein